MTEMPTPRAHAFDDSQKEIGGLTLDSAADKVSIYGSLDITADQAGLALARELAASVDAILACLEHRASQGTLPDKQALRSTTTEANPFG